MLQAVCVNGRKHLSIQAIKNNRPFGRCFFRKKYCCALHEIFFMIKLNLREMKNLSRILSVILCFAPLTVVNAAGPVATTAGSNLTAYNPSNAYNNQWANLSNGRYDSANAPSAKADFGNCNALVLRCAQPKCSNGGCADASVASAIVTGCVQSNSSCKQYGDDLVQYMTAQLVASSNAKINEQNLAAQQAAAAAAAQQSEQQMQQMQYQMQQMQAQMAQQQAESAQQLQTALAEQAAQNAAALESMKSAATEAAKENEAGITQYQQDAIDRGVSADIIERQKIAGQIMTEIENAEVSLKEMKVAMNNAFEYAKCDARGNNCTGPKRIKKWRELATEFLEPYDNVIDKISGGLELAQLVGIDLSQIYMMLNNSCNRWGQYACPYMTDGEIDYNFDESGKKTEPRVCPKGTHSSYSDVDQEAYNKCVSENIKNVVSTNKTQTENIERNCRLKSMRIKNASGAGCKPCTLLKVLTEADEVYQGWIDAESTSDNNTTVVACVSGVLNSSKLFARSARKKNGSGLIDIDKLDTWLNQVEPSKKYGGIEPWEYCDASAVKPKLEKSAISKNISDKELCVKGAENGSSYSNSPDESEYCGYINSMYAICDVHPYNNGEKAAGAKRSDSNDCTEKARTTAKDQQVLWAEMEGGICKVKHCTEGYKPCDGDKICCLATDEEDWKPGKNGEVTSYDTSLEAYRAHLSEMYGDTKEIIGLKTTVISQQMYKQYEYLNATLRRLKTQLEKATLTATLQAAGAKSEDGSSSGGLLGGRSGSDDTTIHLAGANNCSNLMDFDSAYACLQNNVALIKNNVSTNTKKACLQLQETVKSAGAILSANNKSWSSCKSYSSPNTYKSCIDSTKDNIRACADEINFNVMKEKRDQAQSQKQRDK